MPLKIFPTVLSIFAAAIVANAAWEDTGAPPRQTEPTRVPAGQRPAPAVGLAPSAFQRAGIPTPPPAAPPARPAARAPLPPPQAAAYGGYSEATIPPAPPRTLPARRHSLTPPDLYSPLLDAPREPLKWISFLYASGAEVTGSSDDLAVGELEARYNLAQWRNVLAGDIDVDLRLRTTIFGGSAGFAKFPTALLELPLDVDWTWRYLNRFSLRIGMRPGVYADVESLGEGWSIPFGGALYYAATPEFSWVLGIEVRPGWDFQVMPLVGVGWEPSSYFRAILAAPESRISLMLGAVELHGVFAWRNTTYGMSGKKGRPEELTLEDLLLGGGLTIAFSENFRLGIEAGILLERSMKAKGHSKTETLNLDDTPYVRIGVGGTF